MPDLPDLRRFVGGQMWELRGSVLTVGGIADVALDAKGETVTVRLSGRIVERRNGGPWTLTNRRRYVSFPVARTFFRKDCVVRWFDSEVEPNQISLILPGDPCSLGQLRLPWNGTNK